MSEKIKELFYDEEWKLKIQKKLPYLFQIAEIDSSRAGRVGMEVGSVRERILVSLIVAYFGEDIVDIEIPITEAEVDVKVGNNPISIKSLTGKYFGGVKLIWTVDEDNAIEFRNNYSPSCNMLFVKLNWGHKDNLYLIPIEIQKEILNEIGVEKYIKLPKKGINPRGVEISSYALKLLCFNKSTLKIEIEWEKIATNYNPYKKWLDYWKE
ncbi:MAG: ThaI family type II restriction endonuclease [Candidatus Marinimicrobia bacterium]|nr:ThaI family type II restriction endonuclease [Candidatus Neomarinimicrobiota bacterium]